MPSRRRGFTIIEFSIIAFGIVFAVTVLWWSWPH